MQTNHRRHRRLRIRTLCLATILATSFLNGVVHAKGYMTPGFQTRQTRPMRVAVLRPRAEFIKRSNRLRRSADVAPCIVCAGMGRSLRHADCRAA